mgnify:CR=1 FL=1
MITFFIGLIIGMIITYFLYGTWLWIEGAR